VGKSFDDQASGRMIDIPDPPCYPWPMARVRRFATVIFLLCAAGAAWCGCTNPAPAAIVTAVDAAAGRPEAPVPAPDVGTPPDAAAGDAAFAAGVCRPKLPASGMGGNAGWPGGKACAEGSRLWNEGPASDRSCTTDDDCVLVEAHTCFRIAVAREAVGRYRRSTPCVNPASGPCARRPGAAVCKNSCCEVILRPGVKRDGTGR
jgi:hypothetical protein